MTKSRKKQPTNVYPQQTVDFLFLYTCEFFYVKYLELKFGAPHFRVVKSLWNKYIHIYACKLTYVSMSILTCLNTYICKHIYTYIFACMLTYVQTYGCVCVYKLHIVAYTHTYVLCIYEIKYVCDNWLKRDEDAEASWIWESQNREQENRQHENQVQVIREREIREPVNWKAQKQPVVKSSRCKKLLLDLDHSRSVAFQDLIY